MGFGAQNVRLCWENCWIFVVSPPRPTISFSLGLNELRAWQAKVEGEALGSWSAPATAWADHQWVERTSPLIPCKNTSVSRELLKCSGLLTCFTLSASSRILCHPVLTRAEALIPASVRAI